MYFEKCTFSDGKDEKWYYENGKHKIFQTPTTIIFLQLNLFTIYFCLQLYKLIEMLILKSYTGNTYFLVISTNYASSNF